MYKTEQVGVVLHRA